MLLTGADFYTLTCENLSRRDSGVSLGANIPAEFRILTKNENKMMVQKVPQSIAEGLPPQRPMLKR